LNPIVTSFALLLLATTVKPVLAAEYGAGLNVVSAYVERDSTRSGPSVQPSMWTYLPIAHTLASVWSSIRAESPRVDAFTFDTRTGGRIGDRWWLGAISRTAWYNDRTVQGIVQYDTTGVSSGASPVPIYGPVRIPTRYRMEVGWQATWFRPPYRPTFTMTYDLVDRNGLLSAFAIPYTIRLPWIPPATLSPETAFRSFTSGRNVFRFQHLSLTCLIEHHWRSFVITPIASLVIPRNTTPGEWNYWVGLHLGVRS
jgi:hypothetical protein